MKKFFALAFSLLCVGMIFVGCEKGSETYFTDVYDLWEEQVVSQSCEFFDKEKPIVFEGDKLNGLINNSKEKEFSKIKAYQNIFNNLKNDINLLVEDFIHDPKLEGNALKNAQKKVSEYKTQLKNYEDETKKFETAKKSLEQKCNVDEADLIEDAECVSFLSNFKTLINSANDVFAKMYDCACSMYYSGKTTNFLSNEERTAAIKQNYFGAKAALTTDYIYFNFLFDNSKSQNTWNVIEYNYAKQNKVLTNDMLKKTIEPQKQKELDAKIETLSIWLGFHRTQSASVKAAIESGKIRYTSEEVEINGLEDSIAVVNHEKFLHLINSTMKNLSETCASLVAFY